MAGRKSGYSAKGRATSGVSVDKGGGGATSGGKKEWRKKKNLMLGVLYFSLEGVGEVLNHGESCKQWEGIMEEEEQTYCGGIVLFSRRRGSR